MTYFSADLTTEKKCTRAIVLGLNIGFIPVDFRTQKVYRKMLKSYSMFLQDIPLENRKLLSDQSLERAVSRNGLALEFVPKELKTARLCQKAVSQNPRALRWVPSELKTPKMWMTAFEADPTIVSYIPKSERTGILYHSMVMKNGLLIQYVPKKVLRSSCGFEIIIDAVRQHGFALFDVPRDLLEGPGGYEVCLMAVGQNGLVLMEVPMKHRNLELCRLAVRENPEAIEYVPDVVKRVL